MATWHLWGDYVHTRPEQIAGARLVENASGPRKTADANGFDFARRLRNGFEPWAAELVSDDDRDLAFAFASYPTIRGWKRIS
jgi:hypothetical protein